MKIAIIAGRGDFPIQIANENPDAFVLCIEIIHLQVHLKIILKLFL